MSARPHLIVVGAGVAGASAAYFAAQAGLAVTVVDAGPGPDGGGRASDVPAALLNPVRGQAGRVDPRALEGLACSWALVERLEAAGYGIPHERLGLRRPLPDGAARRRFEANLPPELPHRWLSAREAGLGDGWHSALHLPGAGWLSGPALCAALISAAGARVLRARASAWDARTVTLEGDERLEGTAVLCCGGSRGADWAGAGAVHRAGSVLTLSVRPTGLPLSFGAYLTPAGPGSGVLGATFEAPDARHRPVFPPTASRRWLLERAAVLSPTLFGPQAPPVISGVWSGVRLAGERVGRQPDGSYALTGLGSRGFLLGPLLARDVVGEIIRG